MPKFIVSPELLGQPLDPSQRIYINGDQIPGWRNTLATRSGTRDHLLLRTSGGIGDQICAEPTIRWAIEELGYSVSLTAPIPELYRHLHPQMKLVHHAEKDPPLDLSPYYLVDLIDGAESLAFEFHCPMAMHVVDYSSICGFRSQMPNHAKSIKLHPNEEENRKVDQLLAEHLAPGAGWVVIHPGRHWPAKTFPIRWWNHVIAHLKRGGATPVLIGGHAADEVSIRSTVAVNPELCVDFRCKLELMESVALCQRAPVVLTNDSSPYHMAASGEAWVGFLTLAKHPDLLMHYRKGIQGWRMENLSLGGLWEKTDITRIDVAKCEKPNYEAWLPEPKVVADWALSKLGVDSRV